MFRKDTMNGLVALLFALPLIAACSDNAVTPADGSPDAPSVDMASDMDVGVAPDGMPDMMADIFVPDFNPAQSMLLTIPAGTSLCSGFAESRTWQDELSLVSRVDLNALYLILDRSIGQSQAAQFVGGVVHTPTLDQYTPTGSMVNQMAEDLGSGWRYTYTIGLSGPTQPAELEVVVEIFNQQATYPASAAINQVGTVDFSVQVWAELRLGTGAPQVLQRYALCDLPGPPSTSVTATTTAGDQLSFDVKMGPWFTSCFAAGETACLFVTHAEVMINSVTQTIDDGFRLIYAGNHHNWDDKFLFLLEPPIGNVHALLATEPPLFAGDAELQYLDSNMAVIKTETPTWQETP